MSLMNAHHKAVLIAITTTITTTTAPAVCAALAFGANERKACP